jgi:hypothetical protein
MTGKNLKTYKKGGEIENEISTDDNYFMCSFT